jgi:hypothetical protein
VVAYEGRPTATRRGGQHVVQLTPLLHKLDRLGTGVDTTLKIELKAILDRMYGESDASDVPHE